MNIRNPKPISLTVLIILLSSAIMMARLAWDSYLPSIPSIATYFSAGSAEVQLTLTLYLLGFGISQFFYGALSDCIGRRSVFIGGYLLFIIGSICCAFAVSLPMLITGRLIAGCGAGAAGALSRAILADKLDKNAFASTWATITSVMIISMLLAPVIGGYIEHYLGWRYNFIWVGMLAVFVWFLLLIKLPESHDSPKGIQHFTAKKVLQSYQHILATPALVCFVLCSCSVFCGVTTFAQLSPLLMIKELGATPIIYGWLMIVVAVGFLTGGELAAILSKRYPITKVLSWGISLLALVSVFVTICYYLHWFSLVSVVGAAFFFVLAARLCIPTASAQAISLAGDARGAASAFLGGTQMTLGALSSYLIIKLPHTSLLPVAATFVVVSILAFGFMYLGTYFLNAKGKHISVKPC